MTTDSTGRAARPLLAITAGLLGAVLASSFALAGECPVDKRGVDVTKPGPMSPVGVTDEELAAVDLSKEALNVPNHRLRIRKLVVQPGGIVPWHSHEDRPALIYILSGSIFEYASNCSVPIEHKAGDVSREFAGVKHWWKNTGNVSAVLTSSDIIHDKADQHQM
jgi:quercetin dioxygenase-like cupin family protein